MHSEATSTPAVFSVLVGIPFPQYRIDISPPNQMICHAGHHSLYMLGSLFILVGFLTSYTYRSLRSTFLGRIFARFPQTSAMPTTTRLELPAYLEAFMDELTNSRSPKGGCIQRTCLCLNRRICSLDLHHDQHNCAKMCTEHSRLGNQHIYNRQCHLPGRQVFEIATFLNFSGLSLLWSSSSQSTPPWHHWSLSIMLHCSC